MLIEKGTWTWGDEGVDWELHRASAIPVPADCTAAFCLAVIADNKIVLEREADRGWTMLGGHVEDGENIEQAVVRECLEEGGFVAVKPVLYGYRKITATKPVTHPTPGKSYPFPVSYIAYYYAQSDQELAAPSDDEVEEAKAFTIDEIRIMGISNISTVELGWQCYASGILAA
jgi:NADH pyrophosphatase NudC (nudix superfamily)